MNKLKPVFGSTLVLGAGPVGLVLYTLLAQGWADNIALMTRDGKSLKRLKDNLDKAQGVIESRTPLSDYPMLNAKTIFRKTEFLLDNIQDKWESIFLCIPCTGYLSVAKKLSTLRKIKQIILVSPEFGSADLLQHELKENPIEIISLSNYIGASLRSATEPGVINTLGVKKHVYSGGSRGCSGSGFKAVRCFLDALNIHVHTCDTEKEAESKNITSFVHLPFLFNDFSLREVFSLQSSNKCIYKLYPQGPITMRSISNMLDLHYEISLIYRKLYVPTFNLLEFLNANYPVPEEAIARKDITNFPNFNHEKQAYLLYVRYATLLIDPYSQPDREGRYLEFSKFPYQQIYQFNGLWYIPRVPLEDYKKLELLYALSKIYSTKNTMMQEMLTCYKKAYTKFTNLVGEENVQLDCRLCERNEEAQNIG